jgi:hypothetical protein
MNAASNATSYLEYETFGKINVFSHIDIDDVRKRDRARRKSFSKEFLEKDAQGRNIVLQFLSKIASPTL